MHGKGFTSQTLLNINLNFLLIKTIFFFKISSVNYMFVSRVLFNCVFCVFDDRAGKQKSALPWPPYVSVVTCGCIFILY